MPNTRSCMMPATEMCYNKKHEIKYGALDRLEE